MIDSDSGNSVSRSRASGLLEKRTPSLNSSTHHVPSGAGNQPYDTGSQNDSNVLSERDSKSNSEELPKRVGKIRAPITSNADKARKRSARPKSTYDSAVRKIRNSTTLVSHIFSFFSMAECSDELGKTVADIARIVESSIKYSDTLLSVRGLLNIAASCRLKSLDISAAPDSAGQAPMRPTFPNHKVPELLELCNFDLRNLSLARRAFVPAEFSQILAKTPKIEHLDLSWCALLPLANGKSFGEHLVQGLRLMMQRTGCPCVLRSLRVDWCREFSNESLMSVLEVCPLLEHLFCYSTLVTKDIRKEPIVCARRSCLHLYF